MNILYSIVRFYVRVGLHLFYKKNNVRGLDNIPKNGAVLFVANHQNAMMDPILIGTENTRTLYFLARASAFKNKIGAKLLNAVNAIAIYRVRDGVNSKKLNEAVFDKCNKLLNKNKSILIFPEGSHSELRKIRALRAGFTKITFDYLDKNPNKEFHIIPIGMNYSNTKNYAKEVAIIYGKPILASQFYNKNEIKKSIGLIIEEVTIRLKEITVYIDDKENYKAILHSISEKEFLTPKETNQKIQSRSVRTEFSTQSRSVRTKSKNFFYYLLMLNSIPPFLIWQWLQPKVKKQEFISTAKFSLGLTIFPLTYFIQTIIINNFFGNIYALIYVVLCFVIVLLSTKAR